MHTHIHTYTHIYIRSAPGLLRKTKLAWSRVGDSHYVHTLCIYTHTYIHTYIHTSEVHLDCCTRRTRLIYIHTYIMYIYIYIYICMHAYINTSEAHLDCCTR